MAVSPTNPKATNHARSNSLPSRPHPLILQCEEHLCSIRASDHNTTSQLSPSSITHKLNGLHDLHECVNNLLLLPRTQEAFVQERQEKWVDELLDGSLRILDTCSAAKDSIIHTKESVRELQSIIRRRSWASSGGEVLFWQANEVNKYLASRRVVKRATQKAFVNIKSIRSSKCSFSLSRKEFDVVALVSILREVEVVSLNVFESLLCVISGQKGKAKFSGWAKVPKLMQIKKVGVKEMFEADNEFADVDDALQAGKFENMENITSRLEKLESCSQDLEQELERLFRRLIKTRVSLLNILSN